jgi:hypothetical protein
LWAEIPSDEKRTNNAAESYHAHLNEQFYFPHPTIFVFMDVVQKLQSVSYVKIRGSDTQALTRHTEREKHQFLMRQYNVFHKIICEFNALLFIRCYRHQVYENIFFFYRIVKV